MTDLIPDNHNDPPSFSSPPILLDSPQPSLHSDWVPPEQEEGWVLRYAIHAAGKVFYCAMAFDQLLICIISLQIIDKSFFYINMWLYSFVLKLLPCVVLTIITAYLIQALYKVRFIYLIYLKVTMFNIHKSEALVA